MEKNVVCNGQTVYQPQITSYNIRVTGVLDNIFNNGRCVQKESAYRNVLCVFNTSLYVLYILEYSS